MKYSLWRLLQIGKWFRFLRWSTQRRIGHLSPFAMMDHSGFIMAHGRRLRIFPRLPIFRRGGLRGDGEEAIFCLRFPSAVGAGNSATISAAAELEFIKRSDLASVSVGS